MLFESKPIIFEGKQYNSQKELAEAFNIRPAQVTFYKNNLEGLRKFIDKRTKGLESITNPKDRINQIIGTYKIIEFIGNNNRNVPKYKVQCIKCGNILQKDIYNLKCNCNTCKKCKKANQKDPYIDTIIGDYHIDNLIIHHKNKPSVYHATCTECGHTLSQPIFNIKKNCHCSRCKDAVEAYNKFKYYNENGLRCYNVISYEYDYQNKKQYKYLLKCKHCGKEKWINVTTQNLQYLPLCSCQLHKNGKHYAKHHNEIINDWLLEDTGKNAYNSRNRLYKYTCIHCGNVKYEQYGKKITQMPCQCKYKCQHEHKDHLEFSNTIAKNIQKHKEKYLNKIIGDYKIIDICYNSFIKRYSFVLQCIKCGKTIKGWDSYLSLVKTGNIYRHKSLIKCNCKNNWKPEINFEYDNKTYTTIKDIQNAFKVSRGSIIKYIKDNDLEGLKKLIDKRVLSKSREKFQVKLEKRKLRILMKNLMKRDLNEEEK